MLKTDAGLAPTRRRDRDAGGFFFFFFGLTELPHERHQVRFSSSVSLSSRIRLKNSTVSSSVSSRPSCRYGGESLMPRSGNVLIGPSADGHAAVDHRAACRTARPSGCASGCRCSTAPGGRSRTAPCRRTAPGRAAPPRVALRGSSLPIDVELRRRREVEQLLELGHEVDLAAALEDVDALLGGDDRVAVEVGGPLLELGEVLDASSAPAASRTAAGC